MPEARVEQLCVAVDQHLSDFMRNYQESVENLLSADRLGAILVNDRFINGLQADIEAFLRKHPRLSRKLSPTAMRVVASALTEGERTELWNYLAPLIKRRLDRADWRRSADASRAAVRELIEKHLRADLRRHVAMLNDRLKTLGHLLILLQERDRGGS